MHRNLHMHNKHFHHHFGIFGLKVTDDFFLPFALRQEGQFLCKYFLFTSQCRSRAKAHFLQKALHKHRLEKYSYLFMQMFLQVLSMSIIFL